MNSTSPLRYPGGKTRFRKFIGEAIAASEQRITLFVEPFCGGAGAALSLLESGKVNRIALNDVDPLVAHFWQVVFGKSADTDADINWLIQAVESAELSIAEWRHQKALQPATVREAAWKCLYLNRTSFNGILHKAGPVGGWEQTNRTLAARFNTEKIAQRLRSLYAMRKQVVRVECEDWRQFSERFRQHKSTFFYFDPPYYHRAEQLYGHLFNAQTHRAMRDYLQRLKKPWLLSYDDAPEVRALYSSLPKIQGLVIDQTYSTHPMGGASFVGRELVFSNRTLPVHDQPTATRPHVGLSVVGALETITTHAPGPVRTPTNRILIAIP